MVMSIWENDHPTPKCIRRILNIGQRRLGQLDARFGVQCNKQPSLTGGWDPWCQSARCPSASPQLVFPAHEVRVAIGIIFYLV